jgi:hypothetical protein
MSMQIIENDLDGRGCTHGFLLVLRRNLAACGHCDEVVYPDLMVLRNHDFRCESGVCVWYSRDLELEVHRCRMPGAEVEESEFLDLSAPAFA